MLIVRSIDRMRRTNLGDTEIESGGKSVSGIPTNVLREAADQRELYESWGW